MRSFLITLVLVTLAAAIGGAALWWNTNRTTEAAYQSELDALQRGWTENLGVVLSEEDPATYLKEMQHRVDAYFAGLQDLYNRYPEQADPDRAWKEIQAQSAEGRIPAERLPDYEEFFTYVKDVFTQMREGAYRPAINDEAKGLHMDIYSIRRDLYEGVPRLRIDFALWGAPRRVEETRTAAGVARKVDVPLAFTRMGFKFLDADGKIYGEMSGSGGEPFIKVEHPERWIAEFPPQAVLGTWWVEPFPKEAEKVLWEIALSGRTEAGTAIQRTFQWELTVPDGWQSAGDWAADAATQIMPEEYINRTPDAG